MERSHVALIFLRTNVHIIAMACLTYCLAFRTFEALQLIAEEGSSSVSSIPHLPINVLDDLTARWIYAENVVFKDGNRARMLEIHNGVRNMQSNTMEDATSKLETYFYVSFF